ncbi:hypothetical protein [Marinilactibacillus psychrotolerans]|uniref:Yip1 domain-containing protein n=1 Tax=Marinilactibacillus psychrotolerans TaxID=191770 RepID=A0AAV3WVL9_9LACT|nr:hypothetical protein [Marinilactibacillus psychrotolerans]GEL67093.1 hypothetical protein MPS01_12480 [Marinilactibacillus psychrotolerans]GEQ36238.1 hypothetical protein M132T_17460 [Marinilactibacillus psychrotolerans]SDC79581.1 hypothetical protein SAMN04488013_109100 [Marinilactibacillus psychrotolerans]
MNEEIKEKKFPWIAMIVYAVVVIGSELLRTYIIAAESLEGNKLNPEGLFLSGIIGIIISVIAAIIVLSIQYAFTKFPTQWISKEENVYKYDIWEALFYSGAIGIVLNLLLQFFDYQDNLVSLAVVSFITTGLFLLFYYSGEEKEKHIKKVITIVQVAWLILGLILNVVSTMFSSSN